ncbi:LysR family transcriptional regulator [Pluralibacter gergoviae]
MEYRQLRAFVVLAEELHFGRAALRLNIAQPALSQQIKSLESSLGLALFSRDKRNVALTFEGQRLVEKARGALEHYRAFQDCASGLRAGFQGQIILGYVGSSLLEPAMTMLINGYRRQCPATQVSIEEHNVNSQLALLRDGRLDIGLVRSPVPRTDDLAYLDVATRPLVAVLPYDHPLAGAAKISLAALAGMPFLIQDDPPGIGLGWSVLRACERAGFVPANVQRTRDVSVAISLASMGMGVALVPETQRSVLMTDVSYCALEDAEATTTLTMIWKRRGKNGALADFIGYAKGLTCCSEGTGR